MPVALILKCLMPVTDQQIAEAIASLVPASHSFIAERVEILLSECARNKWYNMVR